MFMASAAGFMMEADTPNSAMTHLAVGSSVDGKSVNWMEKVTDEQYNAR